MRYLKIVILSVVLIIIIILAVVINMLRNSNEEFPETENTSTATNTVAENVTTENNTTTETNTEQNLDYLSDEDEDETNEEVEVEEKIENNFRKFIEAINKKDYNTAYSYLEASFKKSNMSTLQDFEKIAQKYFWEQNDFIMGDFEELGNNIYRTDIVITNPNGSNIDEMYTTVTMQLKEGENFIMQFTRPNPTEITRAP